MSNVLSGLATKDQRSVFFRNRRHSLNNERVKIGLSLDAGHRRSLDVLLLVFAGDGVRVTEDEMNLRKKSAKT